ncbi:hypothetical protein FGIG_03920 [Fasciola gigantica]|uniref:Uncharacterized protein n=1 Tax=Fasciola gigantica TaxID=46835 RepID=A0A504YTI9_FASGI|nr:hypothetical protein FGIG_03920 [Fasciola gigantica]
MPGSNRSGQSIELPAPKTVGRVFVMEAATYSSDDYELLCDSGSTKPRLGRLPLTSMCSVRNTPGSGIDESNQLAVKGIIKPRLRRSQTERDRNRVPFNRVNSEDERTAEDIQPRRHQGIFLDDLLYGRENERNGTGNTVKDTKDRDGPKIPTASRPCVDEVDRDPKEVQTTPPVLTLLAAPRVASATVPPTSTDDARQFFEWEPPPPPPGPPPPLCRPEDDQCDPSSDQGRPQMQHRLSETSNLSPSQSSRASTVFCPPWDTAPVGLYLSDLISLCRPQPGPTAGNGSETSRRVRDSVLRRRTLSTLEHRWLSERLSSFIDTDGAGRTEFQKLLGLWMQSNPTERVEKEQGSGEEAAPPPLPQRRRRTRGHKGNATTCGVPDDMRSSKVKPYAIFTCPTYKGAADEIRREDLWKEQPRSHFETNDSFGVYDEAFVDQETGPSSPKDPVISKSGSTELESANPETGTPGSYVYAQVVPYHLRRQHQSQEKSPSPAVKHEELGSVADRIAKFQGKPIMSLVRTSSTSLKSRTGKDSNENTELVEPQDQTSALVQSPPVSPSSQSSSSEDSGCGHGDSAVGTHDLPHRPPVAETPDQTANPNRESGRHIRYFVHRLLKNKNSKVAEQVNLFLECTREGSERGPYRTMQSENTNTR